MTKLFWLDLEMTGLDVAKEVIIEAGVIITDLKLEPIEKYHSVVKQPQRYLDNMDEWNLIHHKASGLLDVIATGRSPEVVENDFLELADQHFRKEPIVLAGNSISQDRLFINKYFPRFSERLHYRMLDVTTLKIIFNNFFSVSYAKEASTHRAIEDIQESINEFKKYLSYIKT